MGNTADTQNTTYASAGSGTADSHGDSTPQPLDHPYKKLGGYLAFQVYGNYILSAYYIITAIIGMDSTSKLIDQFSAYGTSNGMSVLYLIPLSNFAFAAFEIWWANALKNRKPTFLRSYHYICVVLLVAFFLVELAARVPFATALFTVCMYALVFALFTTYFVKSVRVRTYFGSDEYLRLSPFTRNFQAPEPAVPDDVSTGHTNEVKDSSSAVTGYADVAGRGVEAITRGVTAVGRAAKESQVMTQLELANKKAKLKTQISDLEKRRHNATASLGASLYDATKGIASLRSGRERLYEAIDEIDRRREDLKAELKSLETPPPAKPAAVLKCPRCGTDIRATDMFCRGCGISVDKARAEAATKAGASPQRTTPPFKCPRCGSYVRQGDLFCGACGTPIDKTGQKTATPAHQSTPTASPAPRCPRCGTEIRNGEQFCGGCGMPVSDMAPKTRTERGAHMRQSLPNLD